MTLQDLQGYCKAEISLHPELKSDIIEIYCLAKGEVEDGGSENHECELAIQSIEELKGE